MDAELRYHSDLPYRDKSIAGGSHRLSNYCNMIKSGTAPYDKGLSSARWLTQNFYDSLHISKLKLNHPSMIKVPLSR